MVKKIHLLKFHKNADEIENIVFGDSDTEGDRSVTEVVFSDDTIFDLKGKIYRATGIYPPHSYIWFDVKPDRDATIKTLNMMYYSGIKYEDNTWLSETQLKHNFKRLGLGSIDDLPEPMEEGRYKFVYFQREDVLDIVESRMTVRNVGCYVDNRGQHYNAPINPFLLKMEDVVELPASSNYSNMFGCTLDSFGDIVSINVVDVKNLPGETFLNNPNIRSRYSPQYTVEPEVDKVEELYGDVIYPKFDFVSGYRRIPVEKYTTDTKTDKIYICLNDLYNFPKHIDVVTLFNNLKSSTDIPYIEIIDPVSGEKIHKIRMRDTDSTPVINENDLRKWVERKVISGDQNYLTAKILIETASTTDNYANFKISNRGLVELELSLINPLDYATIEDGWDVVDKIIDIVDNNIINFMNAGYYKFVNNNMKLDNSTLTLNRIPKSLPALIPKTFEGRLEYYNKIFRTSDVSVGLNRTSEIDGNYFPFFINCMYPFVHIEDTRLTKNSEVLFRNNWRDKFNLSGVVYNVLINGKYDIIRNTDGDVAVGDVLLKKTTDVIWNVTEVASKITLINVRKSDGRVMDRREITRGELKDYNHFYSTVEPYNISNDKSAEYNRKIQLRWKRVNNYVRLSNLGEAIKEYIKNGYLKPEDKGSKHDLQIRRTLQVSHGGISASELDRYIQDVGRTTDLTERNSGISISINLRPSVNIRSVIEGSGEEDFVRDYVYEIKLTEVDDLSKVADITDFINTLFFTYDKFIDTYTVDKDGRRILRVDEIGDEFVEFVKKYDLPITYDAENGITCRTFTKSMLKELTDDTDSDETDSEDDEDIVLAKANDNFEDDDDEFSDDDLWGNAFGNPDDDDDEDDVGVEESKMGGPELDEKVNDIGLNKEIEFQFPQANSEFKDADAWAKNINIENEIMFYDKIGKFKRDDRMRDEIILSKLYERDPVLFKWERVGFEPFSRLCQPTDRYPVLLNEVEKRELDDKIKKGLADDYTPEDANDCSVDNEDSSDYERCGAIKYGSDEANWFICPKIWCPACKISITEDSIVDDDRCPFCNRIVIDRSKWYLSDTAVAKREYKARNGDELSFKKGAKIDKIIRYEGDMCYGIINKKTGLFPKSHITIKRSYGWPGFERSSKHPKNLWVPCCFNSTLDGNAKEQIVERIKTAYGVKTKNMNKKNPYIIKVGKRKQKILEISRLGALPDNLNALFKAEGVNTKNIAMLPNDRVEGFNMFFRVGAGNSFETRDFLSLIANIYGNVIGDDDYDRYQLINDIIDKITPEIFSRCNRGVLEILFKDIRDDVISPFQNFIEYLLSNEPKNYRYLWDLCTRPGFLFKRGINLVLVDTDDKDVNVICPPFPTDANNSREYVLAIKYESSEGSIFEPVYNVNHKNKANEKIVVIDDNFNPGYDVIKALHDRLRKCGTTPNYGLLKDIYENKGVVATPQAFPLYPAKLIEGMLAGKGYKVKHIRNEYNKVTGLSVSGLNADGTPSVRKDGSSIDFFVPVYPSGPTDKTITMSRARETFTDFLNTFYFLRKIYSDVVKKDEDIIRINVLPTEVVIQDDMIVAVVANSNSIVPVKPTEIEDMSYVIDGVYKFTGIDGKNYELPRSSRKYYAKLDTYIREKPIGILKYSKEISLRGIMNIPEMNVKQVILDEEIFVVFDVDSKNILIPFSPTDLNMSVVKTLDSSLVKRANIFEWVQSNGITDYKLGDVIKNLSGLWKRFDIPTRPARYVLCPTDGSLDCNDSKNVIGLVLETGLQVPVMEMNIVEANKLDMTPYIPDKYSRYKMDYYIDSSQKDKRMRQIAKLEYEEELFNIIKYEFSKYLQTETGADAKQELQSVLDNVFDLIHTRVAREKIYNILDDFLQKHSIERLHSKNTIHEKRMEMKLENYNVPSFRRHYTDKDDADCEKNPHYTYDNRWRKKDGRRRRINKCKIIIPRENLIHDDIADNKRNKIYRIVDEIIRDKTIRMEILDGLVPKSTIDVKYRPIDGGEVIYSSSELEDDTYITLYKRDVSQNLRRDEFGDVVPDLDTAQPEAVVGDFQSEKKMTSMTYLADEVLEIEILGTGERETLF